MSTVCVGRGLKNLVCELINLFIIFCFLVQKICEMGTVYEVLRAERNRYAGELEAVMFVMVGMKDALEVREKFLEEALEVNRVLVAEVERLKKQRTELYN